MTETFQHNYTRPHASWGSRQNSRKEHFAFKAKQFIQDNYHKPITLNVLAELTHKSPYHFSRTFAAVVGEPPLAYLLQFRLERAKQLLENSANTVSDIAQIVGFASASQFSSLFTREIGIGPKRYRSLTEWCRCVHFQ